MKELSIAIVATAILMIPFASNAQDRRSEAAEAKSPGPLLHAVPRPCVPYQDSTYVPKGATYPFLDCDPGNPALSEKLKQEIETARSPAERKAVLEKLKQEIETAVKKIQEIERARPEK
jgi:hypothetical protein